jgi:hypothetical protein
MSHIGKRPAYVLRDETIRANVLRLIAALDLSKPWQVTVEPFRKPRTLSQNALMWKWLNDVAEAVSQHTGMDADDIHEFFKKKFLTPRIVEIGGEAVERYTTTNLSTAEMSRYMDRIYAFVTSELGILLPLPEEMHQRHTAA